MPQESRSAPVGESREPRGRARGQRALRPKNDKSGWRCRRRRARAGGGAPARERLPERACPLRAPGAAPPTARAPRRPAPGPTRSRRHRSPWRHTRTSVAYDADDVMRVGVKRFKCKGWSFCLWCRMPARLRAHPAEQRHLRERVDGRRHARSGRECRRLACRAGPSRRESSHRPFPALPIRPVPPQRRPRPPPDTGRPTLPPSLL